ncbi:uncharacterized protein LOC142625361 [Castanea sativa]|uniref:uncharacterized protein LOC142625361 n=1 Tax=Castanea sativa TaxID=21020 RepID=UPI003F650D16
MVTPEGQISLPVIMGGKEVMVTFIVVVSFSPYRAIFGRPWIHDMGAVPSTLHVKVKFRTAKGITLLLFLIQNVDVFAWNPYEVPSVDPEFIVHKLNVDPLCPPKKQRLRRSAKEHVEAVRQEVGKLKEAGAIRETFFREWLINIVIVKKKSGKWRVCVDFTNLNRACLKDLFPMPKIDQLVDATCRHPKMSFLDAFQGYHQIALAAKDQEKTTFLTPDTNYHYNVMPFSLKNAGAIYQRMMAIMFRDKIGRTVEVYIDDMVIKSKQEGQHIDNLKEVFKILRRHRLRLNTDKCAFGVGSCKFMGYLITKGGIEVSPDQIEAVKRLKPPSNPKELLKKWKGFQWDEECDRAFQDLKDYLGRALTLSAPKPGEDLYMYLSVSEHVASAVLLWDSGVQLLVYYISKMLVDVETRYLPLEKLVLALVHSTQKLPHYFQAHIVHGLTEYPLQTLLRRSDFTGRIAKWGTRLGFFDIRYKPRNSVKGQVLADFIAEFSSRGTDITCIVEVKPWKVFVDGASNAARAGAGIVVITPENLKLEHSFRLGFRASNNEAEYEALLAGLRVVMDLGAKDVEVCSDSFLIVSQVKGNFEAKDPQMIEYLRLVKQMMGNFVTVKIERIARGQNRHADSLETLASSIADEVPRLIRVELVPEPSITAKTLMLQVIEAEKCWMDPIIDFLVEDRAPEDEKEAARVRRTSARYWLSADWKLYRRSFEGLYLQCLRPSQAKDLLAKLHEGVCGSHVGGRSLAH